MGAWRARVWSYSSRERTGPFLCSRACQLTAHGRQGQGTPRSSPCCACAAAVHAPTAEPAQHAQNQCDGPGRCPFGLKEWQRNFGGLRFLWFYSYGALWFTGETKE